MHSRLSTIEWVVVFAALLVAGYAALAAQPTPRVRTINEMTAAPGPILVAATQPAKVTTAPATQPVTQPIIGRVWHVADLGDENDNGDGTAAHPFGLSTAIRVLRNGDELLLKGGDTFPSINPPKGIANFTLSSYGTGRATVDAPTGMLILQGAGTLEVSNINFTDETRDPYKPGIVPHQGGMNLSFRDCKTAKVWVHDCSFTWAYIGIDIESNGQQGTLIENCDIGPTYNPPGRSQGTYESGQVGMVIRNCRFNHCGWWPGIAPATSQSHGVYHHWDAQNPGGPLTVTGCTFIDSAAGGPTSNSGGTFDSNVIIDCARDGSGIAAWASQNAFVFTHNIVIGGFVNAIAKNCTIEDNVFLSPGSFGINVDVPAKTTNWRGPADIVQSDRNVVIGAPVAVKQTNLSGGRFSTLASDVAIPTSNPLLEAAVRRAATQPSN